MLQRLYVKNLALIDEIEVELKDGLNILTGETGAGKSIILGSVNLALGARYSKDMLRKEMCIRDREYQTKLMYLHPENQVRDYRQRIVDYEEKLRLLMENSLQKNKMRFTVDLEKMKKLSPLEKLNQGFSYVETADRKAVKRIGPVSYTHLDVYKRQRQV